MGLNGLLGSNDGFSSNFGGVAAAGVWMIVSVILAIIGGIVLYFVVFTKQNEHKFTWYYGLDIWFLYIQKNVIRNLT